MDTLSETKLETVTVKASDLNDLLTGASVAMDKGKGAISQLASVYLTAKDDGYLTAYATDRYRLIEGKLEREGEGELAECQLRASDVKNILATSLNIILGSDKFPPYSHLFELEAKPIDKIMLNPSYLASFDKVPASDGGNIFTFYGENKPVRVSINHNRIIWRALLMPMKII